MRRSGPFSIGLGGGFYSVRARETGGDFISRKELDISIPLFFLLFSLLFLSFYFFLLFIQWFIFIQKLFNQIIILTL